MPALERARMQAACLACCCRVISRRDFSFHFRPVSVAPVCPHPFSHPAVFWIESLSGTHPLSCGLSPLPRQLCTVLVHFHASLVTGVGGGEDHIYSTQSDISHHPWLPSFQPHERMYACGGGESPHSSHDAVLGEEDTGSHEGL